MCLKTWSGIEYTVKVTDIEKRIKSRPALLSLTRFILVAQNLLKCLAVDFPRNLQETAISGDTEYRVFWIPDEKITFLVKGTVSSKISL